MRSRTLCRFMKTVAVDANPATRAIQTGTEVYAREVARRLPAAAPELRFAFYASRPGDVPGIDFTVLPGHRMWSQLRLPGELWLHRPDLFFAPAHVVPFIVPGPALTVVHGLEFERYPAAYGRAAREYLKLTSRWAERRSARLIAVSQSTADDLVELHGVRPERVTVVHEGGGEAPACQLTTVDAQERLVRLGVDRPFLLNVSRLEPRKNQVTALRAVERRPGLLLVLAGPATSDELLAQLRSPSCRVLGAVSQADLEALYAFAEALVFPSLYEGFGLPVIEAMRRGLPVVTAAVSSLPEVGGDAAVYVDDPRDPEALAQAIDQALADRERLRELGLAQAAKFTWDRTATGVAGVMRELLS